MLFNTAVLQLPTQPLATKAAPGCFPIVTAAVEALASGPYLVRPPGIHHTSMLGAPQTLPSGLNLLAVSWSSAP